MSIELIITFLWKFSSAASFTHLLKRSILFNSSFWCIFFYNLLRNSISWHSSLIECYYISNFQNRADARKALSKNGSQINGVLIVGVKPTDVGQRQALDERVNNQGFMPMPPSSSGLNSEQISSTTSARPYYLQNGTGTARQSNAIASPAKSVVSKVMDLMFGV